MTIAPAMPLRAAARVRESRRTSNLELGDAVGRFRCECGQPGCRKSIPDAAASYRGADERFIVVPAHLGAIVTRADLESCAVVRAADRFFVVEVNSRGRALPDGLSTNTSSGWLKTRKPWPSPSALLTGRA